MEEPYNQMSALGRSKIFVGRPVFNLINPKVVENQNVIFNTCSSKIVFGEVVGASVEHARQILIDQFLRTDCTHFLNIDADILFLDNEINPIDKLVSIDKDIVGGIYVYKKSPCLPVYRPIDLQRRYEREGVFPNDYNFTIPQLPFRVSFMGNGFKLVKREVIEKMKEKYQCPNLPMIHNKEYLSEDWAFDKRASDLNYEVWAVPSIKLGHSGTYTYTLEDYKNEK